MFNSAPDGAVQTQAAPPELRYMWKRAQMPPRVVDRVGLRGLRSTHAQWIARDGRAGRAGANGFETAWRDKAAWAVLERAPQSQGWNTTDEEEIALRNWRGRTDITTLEVVEPKQPIFGTFRIKSESSSIYEVEIRSLNARLNSCGCIDHRVNGLGTCKHIEGVLAVLR